MLLKVIPYGDTLLRRQSEHILQIDQEIQKLISDMTETMQVANGVGLAAPQVGVSKMLFLADWSAMGDEGDESKGVVAYINPQILSSEGKAVSNDEGCLSLPGVWAQVDRPERIRVKYQDISGKIIEEDMEDYPARVFQHE